MLILCVVCFLMPFAGRGARLSVESMSNNVADWLPAEYEETQDLREFRKYFVGDQFVIVSGPWCREGNQVYTNFIRKLREESLEHEELLRETRRDEEIRAHQTGDELGLLYTGNYHETWGENREKWLLGADGQWYFIKREGDLFRWKGQNNIVQGIQLWAKRQIHGRNVADGEYIDTFGERPNDAKGIENEFYANPEKLCARPFKSITTGPDIFDKMAGENGTRRIGLFDEDDASSFATKIKTHQLLTGTLFGPTPEPDFGWTFESLLQHVDNPHLSQLKSSDLYRERFDTFVQLELEQNFEKEFDKLLACDAESQLEMWYRMWDALELEAPPRQTCIIVTINSPVVRELDRVVGRPLLGKARGRILELATGECGISTENLHIGGPPADNVAIDEEGTITLLRLVNLSMLIGIGLAYASFRSIKITMMIFFVGGTAAITSLSFVWFGGSTLDAILMSMPSLVYVLGLSGAVHVVNYYRDACMESGPKTAPEVALKYGWFPCTLAALTTAIGLISLYTSNLVPIQKFGLFSAIATLATVVLLFTYLPSALTIWPPGFSRRESDEPEKPSQLSESVTAVWLRIGEFVIRNHAVVVVLSLILMGIFAFGISKVRTSVHLLKLFDSDAKILQDYRWLEDKLGKLVPMELVVCVEEEAQKEPYLKKEKARHAIRVAENKEAGLEPPEFSYDKLDYDMRFSLLERMELSHRVRKYLERYFGPTELNIVGPGLSTDVFVPIEGLEQISSGSSLENKFFSQRKFIEDQLKDKRGEMLTEDYLAVIGVTNNDPLEALADNTNPNRSGREMWRISLRLAALNDIDYGDFVNNLKVVVEPIMKAYEYRSKILQTLQGSLQDDALIKGRVLVLGRKPSRLEAEQNKKIVAIENVMASIDQTYIFASTLKDLLENRGFTGLPKSKRPYREKILSWGDPTVIEMMQKTQEQFAQDVQKFDCVVLLEDHPVFDVDLIESNAKAFIDGRDHHFEINTKTNLPLPGNMTAMQRMKASEDLQIGTIYTGIIPIVYKSQNQLLVSLRNSIGLAFVLIAFVMMLLLRNWRERIHPTNALNFSGGLISMIPNIFPIIIVFGAMGLMDIAVDIGSMMTASVAMGVAVDDTIHFLNWYRKGLANGVSRLDSIRLAYRRVATAMTQTTLIGGFGLSAFALSTFTPTQRFGVLMLFMLAAALIGDLILLPAILASPLGRFFGKVHEKPNEQSSDDGEPEQRIRVISEFDEDEDDDSEEDLPDIHPGSLSHLKPPPNKQDGSVG